MTKRQTKVPGRFDSFEMGTPRNRRQPESKKATFLVPLRYGSDRDGPEFRDTPVAGGDVLPEHQESPVEASGQDVEHGDQESPVCTCGFFIHLRLLVGFDVYWKALQVELALNAVQSTAYMSQDTRSRAFHGRRRACSTSAAQSTAERQEGKRRMTDHVECDICHETRTWRGFSNHRKWCLYVQAVSATRSPAPEARKRGRPRMEPTQARKRGRPNKTQATERRPENPEVSTQPPPEEENPGSVGSAPPEMVAADIEETIYDSDFQANGDWSSIDAAQVDRQDRIDDDLTTQVDETEDGPPEAAQPTAERQDDEPSDDDSACPNATDQEIWPDPIDLVSITHGLFAFGKVTVNTGAGPAVATPAGGGKHHASPFLERVPAWVLIPPRTTLTRGLFVCYCRGGGWCAYVPGNPEVNSQHAAV
eukprot:TRINITY_DN289_c1_g1_i12.p1 TRINITY_DN289_c1_g1~~TRINITY_DN289_c1_g1_i12.p1  ORF type:complete len:421 (+),score=-14.50 TRINITY_DN289_c1_g1_i12:111-1373(+)